MPHRKRVLDLGHLCALSITQLLVDIIQINEDDLEQKSKTIDKPAEEVINVQTPESSGENAKEGSRKEVSECPEEIIPVEEVTNKNPETPLSDSRSKEHQDSSEDIKDVSEITDDIKKILAETGGANNSSDSCNYQELPVHLKQDEICTGKNDDSKVGGEEKNDKEIEAQIHLRKENIKKDLEILRKDLGRQLTCHSHVMLHELIFSNIMARLDPIYMRQKEVRRAVQDIIPFFLNSSLREFDFGRAKMFSEKDMCKVMFDHLHQAANLQKLIIGRTCYWRSKIFEDLSSKLVYLPNLTDLGIQYICTPEMITGLSKSCPNLCNLNMKGSERITDLEAEEIAKCATLTMLDISGTRVTGKGCWKIVESVKNLAWLQHCAFNCNSDSVLFESRADLFNRIREQLIHGNASTLVRPDLSLRDEKFNLKNFWLFNPQTEDLCCTVLFPQLEHLRLDFVFQDMQEEPNVTLLSALPKLNKFQANLYDRCSMELVKHMVEATGPKLVSLDLHLADDWFFVAEAHNVVASCCPNLETLIFSGDYKARHSLEDSDDRLDFAIPGPAHPNLELLKLTGVVSNRRLRFVLSHTPNLRILHLDGELEWLHDATFNAILETNPLSDLEEVWLNVSTTVTLETVRLLLMQDNKLRCIGRLCHMGGATMEEYQQLLTIVRQRNLDTKLIWVTDERIK